MQRWILNLVTPPSYENLTLKESTFYLSVYSRICAVPAKDNIDNKIPSYISIFFAPLIRLYWFSKETCEK